MKDCQLIGRALPKKLTPKLTPAQFSIVLCYGTMKVWHPMREKCDKDARYLRNCLLWLDVFVIQHVHVRLEDIARLKTLRRF